MNQVNLIGRITRDLELRYTQTQKAICEFSLAVNRVGTDQTDFITCVIWGKQAENLTKYQGKGSLIAVAGELRVDRYQTNTGETRYRTYVSASNIEYLGTKKEENAQNNQNIAQKTNSEIIKDVMEDKDPFAEFGQEIQYENMELPF